MAYTYFHCQEGEIPLHNRDVRRVHAYMKPGPIAEHDRIVRVWCAHFCHLGEAHVLETGEQGWAVQLYKHMRFERKRACCAAFRATLGKSA